MRTEAWHLGWIATSGRKAEAASDCDLSMAHAPGCRLAAEDSLHFTVIWRVVFIEVPVLKKASN